jgi:hypothetical protein
VKRNFILGHEHDLEPATASLARGTGYDRAILGAGRYRFSVHRLTPKPSFGETISVSRHSEGNRAGAEVWQNAALMDIYALIHINFFS